MVSDLSGQISMVSVVNRVGRALDIGETRPGTGLADRTLDSVQEIENFVDIIGVTAATVSRPGSDAEHVRPRDYLVELLAQALEDDSDGSLEQSEIRPVFQQWIRDVDASAEEINSLPAGTRSELERGFAQASGVPAEDIGSTRTRPPKEQRVVVVPQP